MILIDNGVDAGRRDDGDCHAPIEEAMKDIPGSGQDPFGHRPRFRGGQRVLRLVDGTWNESEQYVLGPIAQIRERRCRPPSTSRYIGRRFPPFPILGISSTSDTRQPTDLWETARYEI